MVTYIFPMTVTIDDVTMYTTCTGFSWKMKGKPFK